MKHLGRERSGARAAAGLILWMGLSATLAGCEASDTGTPSTAPQAGATGQPVAGASGTPAAGAAGQMPPGNGMMNGAAAGMAPAMGAPTFSAIFSEILINGRTGNCMAGFCHGGPPSSMVNGNLQILYNDMDGAYDNLVNAVSDSELCAGRTLVVPGDSAGSLLIQKFSTTPPCGMPMPVGPPLSEALVTQIATWIDAGAPRN